MLVAMVMPSHHRVEAGVETLLAVTDGALLRTVLEVTAAEEPSSSRITPPREPHIMPRAAFPASHKPCVWSDAWVRWSGWRYSLNPFIKLSVATPLWLLTFGSAVPDLNKSPSCAI